MKASEAYKQLELLLRNLYDEREAGNIADWVIEHITGKKRWERRETDVVMDEQMAQQLRLYSDELASHKPVQYVLGESWFCGLKFFVNESVLIPRPETEELADRIIKENTAHAAGIRLLDIGSGSGCIPVAIKKRLPECSVVSIDISEEALGVARRNAVVHNTDIEFIHLNFLDRSEWDRAGIFDLIVSNPPYIPATERDTLSKNVTDFEPGVALFVPDQDHLLFYKRILEFAIAHLAKPGKIYLEAHESHAAEVANLFEKNGWQSIVIKDMYGKERFIKVIAN